MNLFQATAEQHFIFYCSSISEAINQTLIVLIRLLLFINTIMESIEYTNSSQSVKSHFQIQYSRYTRQWMQQRQDKFLFTIWLSYTINKECQYIDKIKFRLFSQVLHRCSSVRKSTNLSLQCCVRNRYSETQYTIPGQEPCQMLLIIIYLQISVVFQTRNMKPQKTT